MPIRRPHDGAGTYSIIATRMDATPIADLQYAFTITVTYSDGYGNSEHADVAYEWWAEPDVENARVLLHASTYEHNSGRLLRDLDDHLRYHGWRRDLTVIVSQPDPRPRQLVR